MKRRAGRNVASAEELIFGHTVAREGRSRKVRKRSKSTVPDDMKFHTVESLAKAIGRTGRVQHEGSITFIKEAFPAKVSPDVTAPTAEERKEAEAQREKDEALDRENPERLFYSMIGRTLKRDRTFNEFMETEFEPLERLPDKRRDAAIKTKRAMLSARGVFRKPPEPYQALVGFINDKDPNNPKDGQVLHISHMVLGEAGGGVKEVRHRVHDLIPPTLGSKTFRVTGPGYTYTIAVPKLKRKSNKAKPTAATTRASSKTRSNRQPKHSTA